VYEIKNTPECLPLCVHPLPHAAGAFTDSHFTAT
jgi:hypothetical protein